MRKSEIDHLLEAAVAKALGVKMPRNINAVPRRVKKAAHRPVKHAA